MADQNDSNVSEGRIEPKQVAKVSFSTGKRGGRGNFLDIADLIRSIQRAEDNYDCFGKTQGYCDQVNCAWRPYCLETQQTSSSEEIQR